jgi:UDP-N-acetyl-D-mannosaminuronic acid dehydrogenase
MGIAFKPDIDDLRESPALAITEKLARLGYQVTVAEPNISILPSSLHNNNVKLIRTQELFNREPSVYALLVKHSVFQASISKLATDNLLNFCSF